MPVRPAYRIYQGLWSCLDWLYPPICSGCGATGYRWCRVCQAQAKIIQPPLCESCGQPLEFVGLCENCSLGLPRFTAVRSWAIFEGPVRAAIHRLKYERDVSLGEILARPLIELLSDLEWSIDLILPVPLGVARLKERGYNQSVLLTRPIALAQGIAHRPKALTRSRETRTQVGLTYHERRENVTGAFLADPWLVKGCHALVVDDVATSSATLDACAYALIEAGARRVYGLTLARAGRKDT